MIVTIIRLLFVLTAKLLQMLEMIKIVSMMIKTCFFRLERHESRNDVKICNCKQSIQVVNNG